MTQISKSERILMEVLWESSPLTAAELVQRVQETSAWSDKTILTFLRRLRDKGCVTAEKREVLYYSPVISREQTGTRVLRSAIDELFGGSITRMIANFVDSGELDDDEIDQLRAYLNKKDHTEVE